VYDHLVVHRIKRLIKIVVGFTILGAGVAMLVLPGPGWVVIAVALAILAGEYVWARRLLDRLKETGNAIADKIKPLKRKTG
jgi:uncharacterized protein (TIGR02611 family)